MYFGEGCIYYAESDDLLHWTPRPEDEPVLAPEWGTFTSDLVEAGPQPAFTTDGTALLVHNAAVFHRGGGVSYSCGQVPIDPARPGIVVAKTVQPWLAPQSHEEHHGLVTHVTLVEGLVRFKGEWLAYYGQSDTSIGRLFAGPKHPRTGLRRRLATTLGGPTTCCPRSTCRVQRPASTRFPRKNRRWHR